MERIIYDVGANNGDDIPYYLNKAKRVIAVEANPELCNQIKNRFFGAVNDGRLIVECCVATADSDPASVSFYIHKGHHVLSQLDHPDETKMSEFLKTDLPSRSLLDIVAQYGEPYYMKIDVEGYDHILLKCLFEQKMFPPYISAEAHSVDTLAQLVACGAYQAYKIVDGASIPAEYAWHSIETLSGPQGYAFPAHSAGPFGNDIKGDWLDGNQLLHLMAQWNFGWRDIHASRLDRPASHS